MGELVVHALTAAYKTKKQEELPPCFRKICNYVLLFSYNQFFDIRETSLGSLYHVHPCT